MLKKLIPVLLCILCLNISAQTNTIKTLYENGKYKEALKLVDKELTQKPDDAELNYLKWEICFRSNSDIKENFKYINKAISLNSKYSEAYSSRAEFYILALRFQDALEDAELALKTADVDSSKIRALLSIGSCYSNTRQHKKAIDVNLQVLKLDPKNKAAINNLAMGYQEIGENEKALDMLYKLEEQEPKAAYPVINIGFVLTKMKNYQKAIDYFDKAEKLNKDEPLIYSNRAEAKYNLKDYSGAMADINKSIKLFPSNSYAYRVRAMIYLEQKNTDKACDDLNTALALKYTEQYDDDVKQMRDKNCIK